MPAHDAKLSHSPITGDIVMLFRYRLVCLATVGPQCELNLWPDHGIDAKEELSVKKKNTK